MCSAVSLPISPAPTTRTWRPRRSPKIFLARETAAKLTETARDVHFDAVAGGEHNGFVRRAASGERSERGFDSPHLKVHALAQIDRSCPVADSNEKKMHACPSIRSGF